MKKLLLSALVLASMSSYAQTKKVIMEDYTGVKCGFCVDGTFKIEQLENDHPTNMIPIAIHTSTNYTHANSPLRTPAGDAINTAVMPGGYPAGSVDRKKYAPSSSTGIAMNRGYWANAVTARLAENALVTIGIENVVRTNATDYEFDVNVEFTEAPKAGVPLKLQVYILEDGIEANNHSSDPSGNDPKDLRQVSYTTQYGGNGSTSNPVYINSTNNNYYHNNVLRHAAGGNWGFDGVIPATPQLNTTYTKHVTFSSKTGASPVGWVNDNLEIVAFVAYDGNAAADEKEIINVEEYSLEGTFVTSVPTVSNKNISILNAYPNPASLSDIVKVQYNIANSETVTLNIFNAVGQKVATPYVSNEVKGGHTIQWRASEHGLTPGLYFMEISSASGKQVQRITLR